MDPEEEALDWGDGDLDEEFQEQDQDIVSLGGDDPEEDHFPDNPQESTSELLPTLTQSQAQVKVETEKGIKEDLPLKDQADVDVIPNHPPPPSASSHSRQASSSSTSKDNDDSPLIKARKDLAPGWTTVAVKDSDDFYYYHPISGKTSRIRPREVVKEKIWVNPKTVIGKGAETESVLSSQSRYSTRDSPPRTRISGSGSKRSAANQDGNRSDDNSRLQIDPPSIRSSSGSYISSPSLETNGNFPNKRLRSLNPATESTSPTTQYPGQVYRRESSSNYIGSPTTSSHAKSSEIQDRMGPPSTIARTSDSGHTSRDRDRSSGLDRSGRDRSTSSARIDSRSSRTNDHSGPSGGNSVPVAEAAPPSTSSGAGSLLSRLSAAPVTTPVSLEGASPISESKGNDAGFTGLSIRGSAQLSSKSSRSEPAATTPVEKKSEVGNGRSDAKEVEKRDKEERSKAYQRKEAFTKSRSRSRSPTATFSSRPPISTQASQSSTSQSIPRSSKDSPVRSRDSPPRDTSNRSESSAPSSLDPNPVGIDRYIPKDPDYRFTTTGKWLMSDEKKRLKALLAKKTIPYRSEEEADDEDDRRRAEFSELRLQEGIAPRGWRERDDQYLEVGGEHGYSPRQVYEKMGNRSDHYSSHYSSRKEERGDSSRSPWKNDADLKKRQDYEEEMKMRQREDDYYREKRRQEEKTERSGGKELPSSSSKIIQSSSKMERSTSSHSAGSIPRPHSPPRSKSRFDSRNQNGSEKEKEKSKEVIRTYSPPRTKSAAHSPVREIKASTSSSTPQSTSTSFTSSSSQVKQGSTPAIHPDRLKALGDTSQPAATSSSISDVGSPQKIEYYKDNNVGSGALNELGIPTGPRSSAPVFKPTKYQPGDGTYNSRGGYRGRGGFYGRGRGGF